MNKGLKTLEKLRQYWNNNIPLSVRQGLKIVSTLEEELKDKDELTQALSIATCENGDLLKYKKAFDIIKNKSANTRNLVIYCFEMDDTYEEYVDAFNYNDNYWELGNELLTEEEYNLLKEMLL